jgi:TatD DNase family protein
MLIDTHTHIDLISDDKAEQDRIVERAEQNNVRMMINIGVEPVSMPAVRDLAVRHSCVRYSSGIQPEFLNEPGEPGAVLVPVHEIDFAFLEKDLSDPRCIACGEIGLDYYHNKENSSEQIELFVRQLDISVLAGKPVIIHSRDAWEDTLSTMNSYRGRVKGIFHCFSGGVEEARKCLDLGFFISFAGNLTYPTALKLRESAYFIPCDRTFLETDAPYLTPVPLRGKRNEPSFVAHTYAFYSELKKTAIEEVSLVHQKSFQDLFPGVLQL